MPEFRISLKSLDAGRRGGERVGDRWRVPHVRWRGRCHASRAVVRYLSHRVLAQDPKKNTCMYIYIYIYIERERERDPMIAVFSKGSPKTSAAFCCNGGFGLQLRERWFCQDRSPGVKYPLRRPTFAFCPPWLGV